MSQQKSRLKARMLALILCLAFLTQACFGSFGATRLLYEFNDNVHSNTFVKTLVFWCLTVLPVYFIFYLGDFLILNVVEFFTGSHPISQNLDVRQQPDGSLIIYASDEAQTLRLVPLSDKRIYVEQGGEFLGEAKIEGGKLFMYKSSGEQLELQLNGQY